MAANRRAPGGRHRAPEGRHRGVAGLWRHAPLPCLPELRRAARLQLCARLCAQRRPAERSRRQLIPTRAPTHSLANSLARQLTHFARRCLLAYTRTYMATLTLDQRGIV